MQNNYHYSPCRKFTWYWRFNVLELGWEWPVTRRIL